LAPVLYFACCVIGNIAFLREWLQFDASRNDVRQYLRFQISQKQSKLGEHMQLQSSNTQKVRE